MPGFIYVESYTEADAATLRKVQPARARSEAIFGPFDYDDFLSREKNGEIPDQSGPAESRTNNNAGNTGTAFFTQSETTFVAFGNTVVVGFNDSGSNAGGSNKFTGWAYSTDGGATFTDGGTLPTSTIGDAGDPVMARDELTGRIYYSTLGFNSPGTIQMFRSDDNGVTWSAPVNATPGGSSEDKQWHVVDNFPGPGRGNVYLVSRRFGAGPGIYFFRSTDGGATFGPTGGTLITSGNQGAFVTVGPDHSVYAFWWAGSTLQMRKSTDQGLTFGAPVTVASGLTGGTNGDLGLTGRRQGLTTFSSFRTNSFPHAVVNPVNGHVYVTFNDNPPGVDKADVYLVTSTDGGATWSARTRVNDDATTTDQWQPTLAVSPDGSRLGIFFYSREGDPVDNNLFRYHGRIGTIAGSTVSFLPSFAISSVPSLPEFGRDSVVNTTYMSDYDTAVATPGFFHVIWSDNREDLGPPPAGNTRKDPNVHYEKLALGLAVTSTTPGAGTTVSSVPLNYVVNFSDPIDASTVDASDFTVDGVPANSFTINGPSQVTFHYLSAPFSNEGLHVMAMAGGSILAAGSGAPLVDFSASFRYDQVTLQVVATTPPFTGGVFTLPGPFTYDVTFNEPIDPASVQAGDLGLSGIGGAFVSGFSVLPGNLVIQFTIAGVTVEGALTASIAGGAVTDQYGNPGLPFSATYQVDIGTVPYPVPLASKRPLGSLVYDPSIPGLINFAGDADNFTLAVDGGQTLTVLITPAAGLQPTVDLYDPNGVLVGSGVAGAAGQVAILQTVPASTSGTYVITVGGFGGTTGSYVVQVILNAAQELEGTLPGVTNNALATAQDLAPAFITVSTPQASASRAAVLGQTDFAGYSAAAVPFGFEDISATGTIIGGLTNADDAAVSIPIGFSFPFYGLGYTTIFVSSNGLLTFGSGSTTFTNADLTTTPPQAAIAPFWDDLHTGGGLPGSNVFFQVLGGGATLRLVIQWNQVRFFSGSPAGDTLTFQAVLFASGVIEFNHLDLVTGTAAGNNGASATVGIKNTGTQGPDRLLLAFNNGPNAFVGTGQSTRILPPNPGPDYHRIDLAAGQAATIAATALIASSVSVELRDAGDGLLASGSGGSTNVTSFIANFIAPSAGSYYVRVTGASNVPYNLVVARGAAFDVEDNNGFATAQSLGASGNVLGGIAPGATYVASAVPFGFEDVSATGTIIGGLTNADDASVSIPIGFTFPFYRTDYTSIFVSTNGLLTFLTGNTTFTNADLTTTPAQAAIAPFWDDLHTGGGLPGSNVFFKVLGGGATLRLVIQWNQVRFFSSTPGGDTLTFQAVLFANGNVEFNYLDLVSGSAAGNNGASATVGIKNTGTQGPDRILLAFNNGPNAFVGSGQSTRIARPPGDDWYVFDVANTVNPLRIETATPGDGPFEPVNVLNPRIELYDPSGNFVMAGSVLPDGRNEFINYVPTTTGAYRVRVIGEAGTVGEYFLTKKLTLVITDLNVTTPIFENGVATLTGSFANPDPTQSYQVEISWGAGQGTTTLNLDPGVSTFTAFHTYLDDDPSGTAADDYLITVTVSAATAASGTASVIVTVVNVAPNVSPITGPTPNPGVRGQTLNFFAAFTDVGTLDVHTAVFHGATAAVRRAASSRAVAPGR